MKNTLRYILILPFLLFGAAISAQEKCQFTYDSEKTTLEWTAFKFSEKTGVKGTIQKLEVKNTKKTTSILEAVKDLNFTVFTDTIDSNNPERDQKIKTYFFGSVKSGSELKGNFSNIVTGSKGGTASLNLEFNKLKHTFPVTFEINEQTIVLKGTIDVLKLGLGQGIQKLNEVCSELHKGSDGKSKLWPTVDIKVTSTLKQDCKS